MKIQVSKDGKQVVAVEIDENIWQLKKPMPFSELPELTKHISYVVEHVDFGREQEWSDEELADFLRKQLSDRQALLFKQLSESEDWTPIGELIDFFAKHDGKEVYGVTIAGLQAPITRKCRQRKKESFWESKYSEEDDTNYYRIAPKYIHVVRDVFIET